MPEPLLRRASMDHCGVSLDFVEPAVLEVRGDDLPVSKPDPLNAHATRGDDERTQLRRRGEDAGVAELVTL